MLIMCCTIVFNWTPVFTLFDRWCYFQCSEVSSCMITVADKSLERPIKVILYYHWSAVLLLSVIPQAGLFGTTSLKISAQGSRLHDRTRRYVLVSWWKCRGISKRFSLSLHTCTAVNAHIQTSTINRFFPEMLRIVILAAEKGDRIFN